MLRVRHILVANLLVAWQLGCGGTSRMGAPQGTPQPDSQPNIIISPAVVNAGSPDLKLTITGSPAFPFASAAHKVNKVVWLANGVETQLPTAFVSSSELTAVITASLLADAVTAKVRVEIWDLQGDAPIATSSTVPFRVASAASSIPTPSISSISPSTAVAGSADVTITINGSNFGRYGHFIWSTAFGTTNGNLHDNGTWLQTSIKSDSQLTAVVPAGLLHGPGSFLIVVMNGDVMGMSDGYFGYPRSNLISFTVTP
jgi:hypothetical protein